MNRFKLMMTMIRPRLLLVTAFAVAATVFVSGISVTYAEQGPADDQLAARKAARNRPVPAALKDLYAAKKVSDAERARVKRAEVIKQRKAAIDYSRKVLQGQGSAPAPDTGGTK